MKRRSNPFLAKPADFHGRAQSGTRSHPGFHTSGSLDVVAPYAQDKGELPSDFPVILGFDMSGLDYLADYDAEQGVRAIVDNLVSDTESFEEFMDNVERNADEGDENHPMFERTPGDSGTDILFAVDSAYHNVVSKFAQHVRDVEDDDFEQMDIWRQLRDNILEPAVLADALDQRRYPEDIADERLVVVYWMRPVFPLVRYPYGELEDETVTFCSELEKLGFVVVTTEDLDGAASGIVRVDSAWGTPNADLQHHGTSYRNLIKASPRFRKLLGVPPSPFGLSLEDAAERALAVVREEYGPEIEFQLPSGSLYRPD